MQCNWMSDLGARLGDGIQTVDHVSLGHANTTVVNLENLVLLVRDDKFQNL